MRKTPARIAEEQRDREVELEGAARMRLGITRLQWYALRPLIEREAVTFEGLVVSVYGNGVHGVSAPDDPKLGVQQRVMELRRRLKRFEVEITTIHDFGYAISLEGRAKLRELLPTRTQEPGDA